MRNRMTLQWRLCRRHLGSVCCHRRRRNECGRSNGSCPDQQHLQAKPQETAHKGTSQGRRVSRPSGRNDTEGQPLVLSHRSQEQPALLVSRPGRVRRCGRRPRTSERSPPSARRAAARSAVPMPAPAPSALRPDEATRADDAGGDRQRPEARNAAPADSNAVTATNFSAGWPAGACRAAVRAVRASTATTPTRSGRRGGRGAGRGHAAGVAGDAADDRAAAQPTESAPGLAQLLIFLAATVAFVAIAVRTVLKLTASRRAKPERREPVRVPSRSSAGARRRIRPPSRRSKR